VESDTPPSDSIPLIQKPPTRRESLSGRPIYEEDVIPEPKIKTSLLKLLLFRDTRWIIVGTIEKLLILLIIILIFLCWSIIKNSFIRKTFIDLGDDLNVILPLVISMPFEKNLQRNSWIKSQFGDNIDVSEVRVLKPISEENKIFGNTSVACKISGSNDSALLKMNISYKRVPSFNSTLYYDHYDYVYEYLCKVETLQIDQGNGLEEMDLTLIFGHNLNNYYFLTDDFRLWMKTNNQNNTQLEKLSRLIRLYLTGAENLK
jgi:hypothetical protein